MMEINVKDIAKQIKEKKPTRVLIQIPEGLKHKINGIVAELRKLTDTDYVVLVDPCFGACDLADEKALKLGCDLLLHFGHTAMYNAKVPVIYYPVNQVININPLLKKLVQELKKMNIKTIAYIGAIQYLHYLPKVKTVLEKEGFIVKAEKGTGRIKQVGQVLGCNISSVHAIEEDVDIVLYFGDGLFHAIGAAFATKKEVIVADPLKNEVFSLKDEKDKFIRRRMALISQAMHATRFGIMVSVKQGQFFLQTALRLKKEIEKKGKTVFLFASDYNNPEYYMGIDVDVLINTACTRIASDDTMNFPKIVLNPTEAEIAVGIKPLSAYQMDELP